MNVDVMADITEMERHSLGNVDFTNSDTQLLHELQSVMIGAVGSTKARHGDADDTTTVKAQLVERFNRYQQGQCRVKTSTDAHHGFGGVQVVKSLGKSRNLDIQDFLARFLHLVFFWNKRMRIDSADELKVTGHNRLTVNEIGLAVDRCLSCDKRGIRAPLCS